MLSVKTIAVGSLRNTPLNDNKEGDDYDDDDNDNDDDDDNDCDDDDDRRR